MAINTADKRKNVCRITCRFLMTSLAPVSGISSDDKENGGQVYIGFAYSPPVLVFAYYSKIHQGVGFGF